MPLFCVLLAAVLLASTAWALDAQSWNDREIHVLHLVNEQRAHRGLPPLVADSRLHDAALAHSRDMLSRDFFSHTNPDGVTAAERGTAAGYDWRSYGENIAAGSGRRFFRGMIVEDAPLEAARDVMYGTSDLQSVRTFVQVNGLGDAGSFGWDDIGRGWSDAIWNAWQGARNGNGGWMGSSGHRANILRDGYTDLGVGYVFSTTDMGSVNYDTYWTQNFASGDSRPRFGVKPEEPEEPKLPPPALAPILRLLLGR